jgi:multidrug efflux pump subunit AcrA (membrane-fusion protein)
MGTLVSTLGTIGTALGTVQTIGKAFNDLSGNSLAERQRDQAMRDLQRQQNQQTAEAQQRADEQRRKIEIDATDAERRRRAALKRSIAKRNARFGASGIGGGKSGSREAILLGLYNESETEKKQREDLDKLRFQSITNDLSNIASRNILEKTQLSERQKLDRIVDSY